MKQDPLRRQATGLIAGLTLQYILGMITNMYVQFPEGDSGGRLWEFAWRQVPLAAHIIIGVLLLLSSIIFLVRAKKSHSPVWIKSAGGGLLFIALAGLGGARFIPTQSDGYSLLMAISFIGALLSYVWGLVQSRPITSK